MLLGGAVGGSEGYEEDIVINNDIDIKRWISLREEGGGRLRSFLSLASTLHFRICCSF